MKLGRQIGLQLIKQAVEWGTTESQQATHSRLSEGSGDTDPERHISTLFAQNEDRDPMTAEVDHLNFQGSPLHYAKPKYATTMDHALVWRPDLWTTFNDEKTKSNQLPGKKPVVQDSYDGLNANNVWNEHDSYQSNKDVMERGGTNPGPSV